MDNLVIFLLVIAAVWGLFLLPSLVESRREAPLASTQRYDEVAGRLSMAQRTATGSATSTKTATRRRRTLALSIVVAVGTLVAFIVTRQTWILAVHVVIDAFIAWFVAMLVQLRRQEQQVAVALHGTTQSHEVRVIAG